MNFRPEVSIYVQLKYNSTVDDLKARFMICLYCFNNDIFLSFEKSKANFLMDLSFVYVKIVSNIVEKFLINVLTL